MTIQETKPFGVPQEVYGRVIPEVLLNLAGIVVENPVGSRLVHVAFTAAKFENDWFVLAHEPAKMPIDPSDTWGSFIEDNATLDLEGVLAVAEGWVRNSACVEWVPGSMISFKNPDNASEGIGNLLVRTNRSWEIKR